MLSIYKRTEQHALFVRHLMTEGFIAGLYRREHTPALMAFFLYGLPKSVPEEEADFFYGPAEHAEFPEFGQRYLSKPEAQITFDMLLNLYGRTEP